MSLTSKTITELRDGFRAGDFKAREIAEEYNAAVAAAKLLNAYTVETPEEALAAAEAAAAAAPGIAADEPGASAVVPVLGDTYSPLAPLITVTVPSLGASSTVSSTVLRAETTAASALSTSACC